MIVDFYDKQGRSLLHMVEFFLTWTDHIIVFNVLDVREIFLCDQLNIMT